MITFEGLVQDVSLSKDGTKKYVEVADREHFVTYRVQVPVDAQLARGEITQLEVVRIRAFNGQVSLEAHPMAAKVTAKP
ncbi:hypothetical protein [Alicyclobacillus vulcanalis]|uniref:Uncharacterized protein n=1 Tax=Alicyclobacillus vulcanalis TaxID=252246 RepID=A0A1N7PFA0_9BACL|nr:hypothetical protein [Alicyclobacillus vulcanalis]SIT09238.1 hypothetical protein SAMN05421799_11317 [Alicyclobacillus vulcanalis]